jgi:hypothetical protein
MEMDDGWMNDGWKTDFLFLYCPDITSLCGALLCNIARIVCFMRKMSFCASGALW